MTFITTLDSISKLLRGEKMDPVPPKDTTMVELSSNYIEVKQLGGGKSGAVVYMLKQKEDKPHFLKVYNQK